MSAKEEREARQRAEEAALARDRFLTVISHKLRSPLNGIKSWTHVLQNQLHDSADPMMRRAIDGIMLGVEQQVRLIESLDREVASFFPITREEMEMAERDKHPNPNDEDRRRRHDAERQPRPEPDTLEGPGGRHGSKDDEEARNSTTRRGER